MVTVFCNFITMYVKVYQFHAETAIITLEGIT